jgi:hypothetical protein
MPPIVTESRILKRVELSRWQFILVRVFDTVCICLVVLYLSGGIRVYDHLYLKHGADARRALILLGFAGAFFFKKPWGPEFFFNRSKTFLEIAPQSNLSEVPVCRRRGSWR